MEPADLKSNPPDDARFEAWLRVNADLAPLPDGDFSNRVLAALPAPRRRAASLRGRFCLAGALVGTVVALLSGAMSSGPSVDLSVALLVLSEALDQLAHPAPGIALGVTLVSLWFAFRNEMRVLPRL